MNSGFLENFQGNVGFEPEQGKLENMGFREMGNKIGKDSKILPLNFGIRIMVD